MHAKMHNPSYKDVELLNQSAEANTHIPAFNMFIIIHETIDIIAEMK